jgi:hypothetical protein
LPGPESRAGCEVFESRLAKLLLLALEPPPNVADFCLGRVLSFSLSAAVELVVFDPEVPLVAGLPFEVDEDAALPFEVDEDPLTLRFSLPPLSFPSDLSPFSFSGFFGANKSSAPMTMSVDALTPLLLHRSVFFFCFCGWVSAGGIGIRGTSTATMGFSGGGEGVRLKRLDATLESRIDETELVSEDAESIDGDVEGSSEALRVAAGGNTISMTSAREPMLAPIKELLGGGDDPASEASEAVAGPRLLPLSFPLALLVPFASPALHFGLEVSDMACARNALLICALLVRLILSTLECRRAALDP